MLLMVEKRIKGGICHSIYRYPNARWLGNIEETYSK